MQTIADFCEAVERVFNILGYIPIVSSISGPIRSGIWAIAQIFGGIIGLVLSLFLSIFTGDEGSNIFWIWAALVVNGVLNIIRGTIESIPFLGNLICFLYDRIRGKREIMAYRHP